MRQAWRTGRVLMLAAALATSGAARAQGAFEFDFGDYDYDYGGDYNVDFSLEFESFEFDDGSFGSAERVGGEDDREDPSDYVVDVDVEFEPDEILALNMTRAAQRKARALGFRIAGERRLRTLKLMLARLQAPRGMTPEQALATLRKADPAGYYDRNATYRLAGAQKTGLARPACEGVRCYGQALIGWSEEGSCAQRTRVAMVDSALDPRNPALAGRAIRYRRFDARRPSASEIEHGTAVAALLVGRPRSGFPGLLPNAQLVAADVFTLDDQGELYTDAARLASGLDWVAAHHPAVVNLSIAGPDGLVLRTAVRRLTRAGVAVVAAAGNLGPDAPPQYPAAYPDVLAITAVDRHLQVYARANRGPYVALAAPGVGIWTAGPKGAGVFREGTSFAAPFATATIALLRAQDPRLKLGSLVSQLREQARDLGPPGADPIFGAGLLQARPCGV